MHIQDFTACIFDFDGVVVDSEPLHAETKRLTLEHFQIPYPIELVSEFKGRSDRDFFGHVASRLARGRATAPELDAYKRQLYLEVFENVTLVPGALDFLRSARKEFSRLGLATSATVRDFSLALRKYHLDGWFDAIITGDDTDLHKPDPEPYLKVLAALGVNAPETLVIEDSPNGICSARAAGCIVAAITTTFSVDEVTSAGANFTVDNFVELEDLLGFA